MCHKQTRRKTRECLPVPVPVVERGLRGVRSATQVQKQALLCFKGT